MNNNSRKLSWDILKKVFINKSFSNILLNEVSNKNIEDKFKNLVFAIVHGTITYKLYLEYLTSKMVDPKRTPIELQIVLWMSIYQIKFLTTIPHYAIVNEAVNIAKSINPKFAGLTNACLQRVLREGDEFFEIDVKDGYKKMCIENGYPFFLFEKTRKDYGLENAIQICLDSNKKPPISFRVNTLKISTAEFLDKYQEEYQLEESGIKDCLISKFPIVKSNLYKEGLITIQDPASILVAGTLEPKLDSKVLDMCSAPGGKLTHLAAIMNNTGELTGYEISENKIKLIQQNIDRLNVTNTVLKAGDATLINQPEYFDYILLDAPCSGFGVLKRKPEIKFNNISKAALSEIVELQEKLLDTAYKNLKIGGEMVYSTCSINKDENQNQILKFINKYPNMEIISETQLFGFENNTDGFYICKIIKNA
ncbi:16S rRNA (cytosine(967)-C(5))-methyltransferase RsmB [[Acholeplasma] multilocale]|uniref:16S rRNA (cytosine(967)-C(5))-methyltransferase RsmB n=1 Tax=[Acholeplasma] multilocale TaxID=264638 RepID=UPI00054EB20C|nr:16S rRNA (cytosine(967)-C(5))-methyltransferase RsmB [[Acholeplasma] multilocale]